MCRLRNKAMRDYQESMTTGQTHRQTDRQMDRRMDRQTDAGQSDPYVPLCFACDTKSSILKIMFKSFKYWDTFPTLIG